MRIPTPSGVSDSGEIPSSMLLINTPANNDLVTIGGHDFKFVTALGGAAAFTQVIVGVDADASGASLEKAINGVSAPAEWVEATVPFAVAMYAGYSPGALFVFSASARGGTPRVGAPPNVTLTATISGALWMEANLNECSAGPSGLRRQRVGEIVVTAEMIAFGQVNVMLPFVPVMAQVTAKTAAGAQLYSTDFWFTASTGGFFPGVGGRLTVVFAGGPAPAYQVGDKIYYVVYSAPAA